MSTARKLLLVDDDPEGRAALQSLIESEGYQAEAVASGEAALQRLSAGPTPSAVLLDLGMPGMDGLETLRRHRARRRQCPVIILSGLDDPQTILQAIRLGAADYLIKPVRARELKEILERVAGSSHPPDPEESAVLPLGESPAMRRLEALISRVADSDVPLLITGESGVGKDVVARRVHQRSPRPDNVFVKINCAALPSELLESELFGHEKGSFTGADRSKPGQFELAHQGTLFLDEIAEMPPPLQAKLLQALQDGEFFRVGGERKIQVDVRVIVATNRDLQRAMAEGSFRQDLYYRLNVVHLHIPPLRERPQDIPGLLVHLVDKYSRRYGWKGELPKEVTSRFLAHSWPGNVRELENAVRRLMVLQDPAYVLEELGKPPAPTQAPPAPEDHQLAVDLREVGRRGAELAEREAIVRMLGRTLGDKKEAARRLHISYKALLYKIHDYGVAPPRSVRTTAQAPEVISLDRFSTSGARRTR
jgi:two-component system response regulator AtoC